MPKVSKQGSIVIPIEIRRRYKLVAGAKIELIDYGDMLCIHPIPKNSIEHGYGMLKRSGKSLLEGRKEDREFEKKREKRLMSLFKNKKS